MKTIATPIPAPGSEPTALHLPWNAERSTIYAANGLTVADIHQFCDELEGYPARDNMRAVTQFIVTAINERAGLVAALKVAKSTLTVFAENQLSERNCATVELAGTRVRVWAKDGLKKIEQALSGLPAASNHDENAKQ